MKAKQSRIHNVSGIVSFCQEESVADDYLVNSVTLVTAVGAAIYDGTLCRKNDSVNHF